MCEDFLPPFGMAIPPARLPFSVVSQFLLPPAPPLFEFDLHGQWGESIAFGPFLTPASEVVHQRFVVLLMSVVPCLQKLG